MKTWKILAVGLVTSILLVGCTTAKDEASDLGSDISSDVSTGMSDISSSLSKGASDVSSDVAESVSTDVPAEIHVSPATTDLSSLDGKKQCWGQGVQLNEQNKPLSALKFQEKYGKYDTCFIGNDEKTIYLTFDEGYENGFTPAILDTLKEKKIPAVFFVTMDYVKKEPALIKRMIAEGHAVGNHSEKHVSYPEVSLERCEQETMNLHHYVVENFNYTMSLFRPPKGEFSEQVLAQTQQLGYKTMLWSYAYVDWDPKAQMEPSKALGKVTGALHNGAIYLLHAVGSTNAEILGDFIDFALSKGYSFQLFS